jgi:thiamine biosynthesis lipoprotein
MLRLGRNLPLLPLLLGAALGPAAGGQEAPAAERIERHLVAMGTGLGIEVEAADRAQALEASERAVRAIEAAEARLSTWRPDSELQRLNRTPPREVLTLSAELAAELRAALDLSRATGGAFDPTCGAWVDAYDLRGIGRWPDSVRRASAAASSGLRLFELEGNRASRRHGSLRLEEGGWGKGAGLDAALAALAEGPTQAARLDFGGQLAFAGSEPRRVVLADPRARDRAAVELHFPAATVSVATSAVGERLLNPDGRPLGHLLDPRSGLPAPDFGSLSVGAATALAADALSTGLYVLGPDAALAHAAAHPGVEVVVLEVRGDTLHLRHTSGVRAEPLVELTVELTVEPPPGQGPTTPPPQDTGDSRREPLAPLPSHPR